jgi:hypothetical protein
MKIEINSLIVKRGGTYAVEDGNEVFDLKFADAFQKFLDETGIETKFELGTLVAISGQKKKKKYHLTVFLVVSDADGGLISLNFPQFFEEPDFRNRIEKITVEFKKLIAI